MKRFIIATAVCMMLISDTVHAEKIVTVPSTEVYESEDIYSTATCTMEPLYLKNSRLADKWTDKYLKPTKSELKQAKKLYNRIKKCKKGKKVIIQFVSEKKADKLMALVNAKYFPYVILEYASVYSDKYGDHFTITYKQAQRAIKNNKKIKAEMQRVISELGITKNTTQVDAIEKINSYLMNLVIYESYGNVEKLDSSAGSLLSGKGVCHDYAVCFQYLAQYCGINSGYVLDVPNNHAYNVVKIAGQEYFLDVCWNDCWSMNKYFMLSKEQILKDHCITSIYYYVQ